MKKEHRFEIVFLGIVFLVPFVMGLVKLFSNDNNYEPGNTYRAEIVDAPNGLNINGTFIKDIGYQATIKVDTTILTDKLLPNHLDEVKSGENIVKEYNYNLNSDQLSASLLIMEKDVKGDISVKLTLVDRPLPPVVKANITLDSGDSGYFVSGSATIDLTLTQQYCLGDFIEYEEPVPFTDEVEFKYWLNGEDHITSITSLENLTGDVTLTAFYDAKCVHDYHYKVIDNQLYSVCSKCGKAIHYTDNELGTDFAGKMLVKESNDLILHEGNEFATIVNKGESCEFYFIHGDYHLDGNPANPIDVKIHGINNNEGETNARIICYNGQDGLYPVEIGNLKLDINNIIMQGRVNQDALFYDSGLEPYSLNCDNCYFIGEQALFPQTVEIKNSCFDTTSITAGGETDYAFYTYTAKEVTVTNSTFNSLGKAIKVYGAGPIGTHITVSSCTFNADEESLSDKAAIQIDSSLQTIDDYVVKIDQCIFNGKFANKHWDDTSTHSQVTEID